MNNKILLSIIVVLSFILMVVISIKEQTNHFSFPEESKITIKNEDDTIETLNLNDYLIGVLAAEIPASFHEEALKAQAVASRTYAIYKIEHTKNQEYNILTDITNQVYINDDAMHDKWGTNYSKYYEKIKQAVLATENEIITFNNEPIEAFYFAMSNGYTEESENVFSENLPYIQSTESSWDNSSLNNFEVTSTITKSEFCQKLSLPNCEVINITDIKRNNTHRIDSLVINNKSFKGTYLRTLLNLRSTDISFEIKDDVIYLTTKGYGHGVGMSQYGANGMATSGYNYQEILKYYYHNVEINKMV